MKKFTFKNDIATGRFRSFALESCDIKLGGIIVGYINEISSRYGIVNPNDGKYTIRFMVRKKELMEDKNPNCEWKWVTFKYKTNSIQDAKDFVKKHSEEIQKQFNLFIDERKESKGN